MSNKQTSNPFQLPTIEEYTAAWNRVFKSSLDVMSQFTKAGLDNSTTLPFDPSAPIRLLTDLNSSLLKNPQKLHSAAHNNLLEWTQFYHDAMLRSAGEEVPDRYLPEKGDRRFYDKSWQEDWYFRSLKEAYLLVSQQLMQLVSNADELDDADREKIAFLVRQFIFALAPTNSAITNPEVIRKTFETSGLNLVGGLANFLEDLSSEDAWVQRRNERDLVVGEDVAATPGHIVYQNDIMQIIQYSPATEEVYERPILYVPPLVNKYYLMDLKPSSSVFGWLVEQGHTVFTISWKNPDASMQDVGFEDYVLKGAVEASEVVSNICDGRKIDLFSFCMGGSIALAAIAYLTQKRKGGRFASATMLASLIDYSNLGEWSTFTEGQQVDAFNEHLEAEGMISANGLQKLFMVVRANDLIWNAVVAHYLMDVKFPASDLLYWFEDGANMTKAFSATWSRDILQGNALTKKGGVVIDGVELDLKKVKVPIFNLALKEDHVSAWEEVYKTGSFLGGEVTFVLGGSGHNAGIINPPKRNKHGFFMSDAKGLSSGDWLETATKNEGSWWPTWHQWLTEGKLSQKQISAPEAGSEKYQVLEAAPGSYVLG